jgi:phage protein D
VSNYFAPAFQVLVNGSHLEADVSMNIESITVTSMPDTLDTFTFTLVNTLPDMRWTHTSDGDLFREGNSVNIAAGYVDDLQDMIEGEITNISPTFPADGIPTVEISGHTRMHRLRGTNNTRTFQHMTHAQVAQQIAQANGLQAETDNTEIQFDYLIQPNQSDLDFLKQLAKRIHYEILVQGKKLIFRKAQESHPKMYTLVWAGVQRAFASGGNTLPLKSFAPELNATAPASNVQQRAYDPTSKQALVSNAGPSDQTSTMGGSQSGSELPQNAFQVPRNEVDVSSPFATQAEGDQRAKATLNQRALQLIKGTAETIGIPDLRSGQNVQLLGLGQRFEGLYHIDQATHTINASGYSTSLHLTRNSIS